MRRVVLVIHNVRSAHNVGSLFRTADGLGIEKVILSGYTPYPAHPDDERLPHIRRRTVNQLHKTALGAEETVRWQQVNDISACFEQLRKDGYSIAALEQTAGAQSLDKFVPSGDIALVVGNEVGGIDGPTLQLIGRHVRIPMLGAKESFNVAIAAAIALYHLTYLDKDSS